MLLYLSVGLAFVVYATLNGLLFANRNDLFPDAVMAAVTLIAWPVFGPVAIHALQNERAEMQRTRYLTLKTEIKRLKSYG